MKIQHTYIILTLTAFSFLASSAVQSLAVFTDLFKGHTVVLNLSNQEEENESSGKEELNEVKEHFGHSKSSHFYLESSSKELAYYYEAKGILAKAFQEVITPPPELG